MRIVIDSLDRGSRRPLRSPSRGFFRQLRHQLFLLGVSLEEEHWLMRGVRFGRARKEEQVFIQRTLAAHAGELDNVRVCFREFVVARRRGRVIAFGRVHRYRDGTRELASLFVTEEERGRHLGCGIVRQLLRTAEGKIYAVADPKLERYYVNLGFRLTRVIPPPIRAKEERMAVQYPDEPPCLCFLYDTARPETFALPSPISSFLHAAVRGGRAARIF